MRQLQKDGVIAVGSSEQGASTSSLPTEEQLAMGNARKGEIHQLMQFQEEATEKIRRLQKNVKVLSLLIKDLPRRSAEDDPNYNPFANALARAKGQPFDRKLTNDYGSLDTSDRLDESTTMPHELSVELLSIPERPVRKEESSRRGGRQEQPGGGQGKDGLTGSVPISAARAYIQQIAHAGLEGRHIMNTAYKGLRTV
jgi:hypothetical protein